MAYLARHLYDFLLEIMHRLLSWPTARDYDQFIPISEKRLQKLFEITASTSSRITVESSEVVWLWSPYAQQ